MLFKILKNSLNSSLDDLCKKDSSTKKAALRKCQAFMESLSDSYYSGETPSAAYGDASCRWAYMYTHVAVNADLMKQTIEKFSDRDEGFAKVLLRDEIEICAIGGGPGSEMLAFAKYYKENRPKNQICLIFKQIDLVQAWAENIDVLKVSLRAFFKNKFGKRADWPVTFDTSFTSTDISNLDDYSSYASLYKCDVAVFSYVISEIFDFEKLQPVLEAIREGQKDHAYVIITDRSDKDTSDKINKAIKVLNGEIVCQFKKQGTIGSDEQRNVLEAEFPQVRRSPRVTWKATSYLVKLAISAE